MPDCIHDPVSVRAGDLPFFVPGTEGVLIHPKVAPQDDEHVITKNYPNSFHKTDLKETLDSDGIE